jgi:predicted XRE-type DNA-binding protein
VPSGTKINTTMKKIKCDFAKEKNGNSKIVQKQADEIRHLHETEKLTQRAIAAIFGISKTHTRRIIRYESWA